MKLRVGLGREVDGRSITKVTDRNVSLSAGPKTMRFSGLGISTSEILEHRMAQGN